MSTPVDITFHFDVADQEPGEPQTVESLREWLMPQLLRAVRGVIGYPGDSDVVYAPLPYANANSYDIELPDCEHYRVEDDETGNFRCLLCEHIISRENSAIIG